MRGRGRQMEKERDRDILSSWTSFGTQFPFPATAISWLKLLVHLQFFIGGKRE